ncbi:MAG: hypothetical protein ACYDCK_12170 [Thermoplasmatota archaeon]
MRFGSLGVFILLLGSGLAGCLSGKTPTTEVTPENTNAPPREPRSPTPSGGTQAETQANASFDAGQRWHFHNYWGTSPNLTLFDGDVDFQNGVPDVACCPPIVQEGRLDISLAQGKIVPPETGRIDVRLLYNATPLLSGINVSFKPANSQAFIPAGAVKPQGSLRIPVSSAMTDVPHRSRSLWQFRLEAEPAAAGVGIANGTVHVKIVATIGRPIFIDPPHIDNWQGQTILHEFKGTRAARVAKSPDGTYFDASSGSASTSVASFPLVNGSIIPEGTQTVLARLRWTSDAPLPAASDPTSLSLTYSEENAGTKGALQLVKDSPGERIFKLAIDPKLADNPYGNQSTWIIDVNLDATAGAFSGSVTLDVWAAKLPSDVAAIPAGSSSDDARTLALPVLH